MWFHGRHGFHLDEYGAARNHDVRPKGDQAVAAEPDRKWNLFTDVERRITEADNQRPAAHEFRKAGTELVVDIKEDADDLLSKVPFQARALFFHTHLRSATQGQGRSQ